MHFLGEAFSKEGLKPSRNDLVKVLYKAIFNLNLNVAIALYVTYGLHL